RDHVHAGVPGHAVLRRGTACAAAGDDHGVRAVRGPATAARLGMTVTGAGRPSAGARPVCIARPRSLGPSGGARTSGVLSPAAGFRRAAALGRPPGRAGDGAAPACRGPGRVHLPRRARAVRPVAAPAPGPPPAAAELRRAALARGAGRWPEGPVAPAGP